MRYPLIFGNSQTLNPKPYRSLIGALKETLIDPFNGTPYMRSLNLKPLIMDPSNNPVTNIAKHHKTLKTPFTCLHSKCYLELHG